jgi:hypothetical protein
MEVRTSSIIIICVRVSEQVIVMHEDEVEVVERAVGL